MITSWDTDQLLEHVNDRVASQGGEVRLGRR
jgi:hypothetical protein